MKLVLIIIATVLALDVLFIAACIKMAGDCSREEEKTVHCKECQHWDPEHCSDGQGWCPKVVGYRRGDWYCAAGERKAEE